MSGPLNRILRRLFSFIPGACCPMREWWPDRESFLRDISALIQANLNDAYLMAYMDASRSTANYIAERMKSARCFRSAFTPVRGDQKARFDLLRYAVETTALGGLILEFGVHTGDTVNFIARHFQNRSVFGFDSFQGLPEDWFLDTRKGTFDLNGKLPKVESNVTLVPGWFQDTLPAFLKEHPGEIALLHIDCDLYESARFVLEQVVSRLRVGSVLVFDEYFNYPGWESGEYKALQELVSKYRIGYSYLGYTTQWYSAALVIDAI